MVDHPLYRDHIVGAPPADDLALDAAWQQLPFLTKHDLLGDGPHSPSILFTRPLGQYVRYHQTSGSRGWPMPVLDTADDWRWWLECWQHVLDAADVTDDDIAMMAFSFGPFIGFWSANDALVERGTLVIPGGGLSSLSRLRMMIDRRCTVLCCTPTYAMHLAEVAAEHQIDLRGCSIDRIIVAGEPGGSIPVVRASIAQSWDARVIDHAGASEIGAWGFATAADDGLHVLETEFIAEFWVFDAQNRAVRCVTADTVQTSHGGSDVDSAGPIAELVLSNLGRRGGPLMRYRTGDMVRPVWDASNASCRFVRLVGGVLGRADDMLVIRGVNVFPGSVEAIVRQIEPHAEFRMIARTESSMDTLKVVIESDDATARQLELHFQDRLAMKVPVQTCPKGTLPRSDGKSQRWVDRRPRPL